jgi:GDP-4-dehydro-6-deoxy-D-mannose reductase
MTSKRLLITGAGGFVGGHLTHFVQSNNLATVFRTTHRPAGDNPVPPTISADIGLYSGDLADAEFTNPVVRDVRPDLVIHLAAQSSVAESWKDPAATIVNNTVAQLRVLEAVAQFAATARVVVIGSSEEYGRGLDSSDVATEDSPLRPTSPYAMSKVVQDYLGLQYYLGREIDVVRARPFNLFGPGQSDRFAIASFARQIAEAEAGKRRPTIDVGNLEGRRDYTDVRDAVKAYWALLERGKSGEVYNVGGGGVRAIGDILSELIKLSRCSVEVRTDPSRYRPADSFSLIPNVSRIRDEIGWRPEIGFEQTVSDILADWRARIG